MSSSREAVRIAIAGASSLLGQDLKQWLEESDFPAREIRLLDEESAAGTLTEAGGEPAVIESVNEDSFEGVRFAFFTGSGGFSAAHAGEARRAGATVIDLSGGLTEEPDARLWIPELDKILTPPAVKASNGNLQTLFVAPSAPAVVAISVTAALEPLGLVRHVLTAFQPVSERGREGIEELESQVVKLLSFERIPQKVYDVQVGFNMVSRYGDESAEKLSDVQERIVAQVRGYLGDRRLLPAIALVQAPVFHSYTFTAYVEFGGTIAMEGIVERLKSAGLGVEDADDIAPSNVSVAGESRPVLALPQRDPSVKDGFWLWGAADNLCVPAANAVAIAEKLLAS